MKLGCVSMLLAAAFAFSDNLSEDHDETLLLQTRAVAATVKTRRAVPVHRYHLNLQEGGVSLIQKQAPQDGNSVPAGAVVYQACATDNEGVGEETASELIGTTDSCSGMDITIAETGDYMGHVEGCAPSNVDENKCFTFPGSADWIDAIGEHGLTTLETAPSSGDSEVFLIDVPALDESQLSEALDEIENHVGSNAVVLFQGTGAESARKQYPTSSRRSSAYRRRSFSRSSWYRRRVSFGFFSRRSRRDLSKVKKQLKKSQKKVKELEATVATYTEKEREKEEKPEGEAKTEEE